MSNSSYERKEKFQQKVRDRCKKNSWTALPKIIKSAVSTTLAVKNFYYTGKGLYLGKIVKVKKNKNKCTDI